MPVQYLGFIDLYIVLFRLPLQSPFQLSGPLLPPSSLILYSLRYLLHGADPHIHMACSRVPPAGGTVVWALMEPYPAVVVSASDVRDNVDAVILKEFPNSIEWAECGNASEVDEQYQCSDDIYKVETIHPLLSLLLILVQWFFASPR